MPPQLPPESHYDPKKLQKIFAIAAVVLLLSLIGLFVKDYSREWKGYQRDFRWLEIEKARVKLDAEDIELAKNEDYKKVVTDLADAQKKMEGKAGDVKNIKAKVTQAEAVQKIHVQQSQFAKAERGALKYQYETAASLKSPKADAFKDKLDKLDEKIAALRLKIEADDKTIKVFTDQIKAIEQDYKVLDKTRMTTVKRKDILMRKLKRIDTAEMTPANQLAEMVRDLPIIDLANPNYKIKQIVVKDIPEDVNFMKVPRVDRCTTCHLGIDNADFKGVGQPFGTHPKLELYLDKNSPHPIDQFACTTCHMGRGRATDFISAAHTPRDEEQKKEWEKKYNWHELDHWEQPMLPAAMTQASCIKCHQGQSIVKGADQLNLGVALIERAGCFGCHTIDKFKDWPRTGPSLEFVGSKTTKEWAYHWIANPKSIRPDTWMPSYFNQTNNSDPASIKRSEQEIHAIVAFLFANSKTFKPEATEFTGDANKGKELIASIGCMGCHLTEPQKEGTVRTRDSLHKEFGPNLLGLGSKTTKAWLFDWLKDPKRYHGQTRMPNLRLTDDEAANIAAYLIQDQSAIVNKPVPPINEKIVDSIVMDFLKKSEVIETAKSKLAAMDRQTKLEFAGQRLVREYGCFSCHKIPGLENEKPIGADLTEEGSKDPHRLDFGFTHIEHSRQAWFQQKLLDPRIFDKGKVLQPLERIKMPNFNFTPAEAEAVTTVIMGLVKDKPNAGKLAGQGVKAAFVNEGQKTMRQFNCQGCHIIENEGGAIQSSITEWLVAYQGREAADAKSVTLSFSPPNLLGVGQKIQAEWMYDFIHEPSIVRPWLNVRMPTYGFHAKELNSLVKYFNYLDDQDFPFTEIYHPNMSKEEFDAASNLVSNNYFDCGKCHIIGNQTPTSAKETWAPNFALAAKRLKPDWIVRWITNPPALQPTTKMPAFYDPKAFDDSGPTDILGGDEKRQINALRDFLLSISANPEMMDKFHAQHPAAAPVAPAKTEPAKAEPEADAKKPATK